MEIQDKAYDVSGRIGQYTFYVYGSFEGHESVPINVTFKQYKKLEIGDTIKVNIGKRLFHRGYYFYDKNPVQTSEFHFHIIDDGDNEFLNYLENEKLRYEVEEY